MSLKIHFTKLSVYNYKEDEGTVFVIKQTQLAIREHKYNIYISK